MTLYREEILIFCKVLFENIREELAVSNILVRRCQFECQRHGERVQLSPFDRLDVR